MRALLFHAGAGLMAVSLGLGAGCTSSSGMEPGDGGAGRPAMGGGPGSPSGGASGAASGGATGSGSGGATASGSGGTTASGGSMGIGGGAGASGGRTGSGGAGGGPAAGGGASGLGGSSDFGVGGPSRCATANVALCEDFENGLSSSTWTMSKSGDSMLAVDDMRAARGSKALHFKTTAGDFAYITEKKTFPATNNILYGRMYVWFEDDITTTGHFSLAEGGGGTETEARFGGQFQVFGVGNDGGPSGDWTDTDDRKKVIPSKTWICAEFELKGDTNEFRVWWDDQPRTALSTGATKHQGYVMPTFKSLWFGWWMYNMKEPQELWIDEIAVDFKPIGCAR